MWKPGLWDVGETSPEDTWLSVPQTYSERNGFHEECALCILVSVRKVRFTGRQKRLVGE